jgi:hypothetical protein
MKRILIAIGLLASIGQVPSVSARSAGPHPEDPWNPSHIDGLPSDVRSAVKRMCSSPRAEHQFASYLQHSRVLVLHFEHWRCGAGGPLCTQAGCLHHVYILSSGRYRLLRTYYAPAGD